MNISGNFIGSSSTDEPLPIATIYEDNKTVEIFEGYTNTTPDAYIFIRPHDISTQYEKLRGIVVNQIVLAEPLKKVSESVIEIAARMANICRGLFAALAWPKKEVTTVRQNTWRELSLESVRVGCNVYLQENLTDGNEGLKKSQMQALAGITKQASNFFYDFCKFPERLQQRNPSEIHEPIRLLIGNFLRKKFPEEKELHLHFDLICQNFFQGFLTDFLTPEVMTKILLNFVFPYGGDAGEEENIDAEVKFICREYESECDELGGALLECIDILLSSAKNRLIDNSSGMDRLKHKMTKGIAGFGVEVLKKFKKNIGGFIFATINSTLRTEGSKVLEIAELWIKSKEEAKEGVLDEATLREKLDESLRKDFTRLIKYVISDKEGENKVIKNQAEKIILEITPIILDLIWNRKAMPIAHLICFYIPQAPALQVPPILPQNVLEAIRPRLETQRIEGLVIQFVQDYLLTKQPEKASNINHADWDAFLMSSIKIGIRRVFQEKRAAPARQVSDENTLQLGFIFAAVNRFFSDSIEKQHQFNMTDHEIEKPLVDFLKGLAEMKVPQKTEVQDEVVKVLLGLVNSSIETLLNPVVISNLILKIKLVEDSESEEKLDDDMGFVEIGVVENVDQKVDAGFDAVGLEAVRLLRTIFMLGNEKETLSLVDAGIAGLVRTQREMIGSKIAQAIHAAAISNDTALIDIIESVLWQKHEGKSSEPIFYKGWKTDEKELKRGLENWITSELLPFISNAVLSQELGYGSFIDNKLKSVVEKKLKSIVSQVTQKLFKLIWHHDNKAIRVLILHYLLPIIKR